ncbi:UPF0545 protein C22orf39 homolog [Orussus abietinus]|uniref:UPF0545 protein C22orf39 homolog n=1 Tax=Orussus abietinus TaxID=222816 RepID=UPI000625491C|nr:UPF0545 protein C22orf39 homolog [Orussus abietinus]
MSENKVIIHDEKWIIRPCEVYKEEYSDCRSLKARFHQYFIFGKMIECSQWKTDYSNCQKFFSSGNETAYKNLIESEKKRRQERLTAHYGNNVWEKRTEPPENWNSPLPEWLVNKQKNSYLTTKAQQIKEGNVSDIEYALPCTIL